MMDASMWLSRTEFLTLPMPLDIPHRPLPSPTALGLALNPSDEACVKETPGSSHYGDLLAPDSECDLEQAAQSL